MSDPLIYKPYTLVLPLHPTKGVLLGMKKRGFGEGKWNGFGGKPEACDASFLASAARELHEESGLLVNTLSSLRTRAILFLKSSAAVPEGIEIWVYTVDVADCTGEIIETEEMAPRWWLGDEVPYEMMWDEHRLWVPRVLGERGEGRVGLHYLEFGDEWDGVTKWLEEWVGVEEEHGGREGELGMQALKWLKGVGDASVKV